MKSVGGKGSLVRGRERKRESKGDEGPEGMHRKT